MTSKTYGGVKSTSENSGAIVSDLGGSGGFAAAALAAAAFN